jgi:hypothetical protein
VRDAARRRAPIARARHSYRTQVRILGSWRGIRRPWAPPLVELTGGVVGHLLAWERHERDGSWWAWVSWIHQAGSRSDHKIVLVRASSLRPLEPPEAYKTVPRRMRGCDGRIRRLS